MFKFNTISGLIKRSLLTRSISTTTSFHVNSNLIASKFPLKSHNIMPLSRFRLFSSAHPLTKEQVQERVFNVLKAFDKISASVTANPVQPSALFTSDLGLDSLDVVEVVMAVEEEFGLEIPDEAADEFKSPEDVINFIHGKMQH